MPWVLLVLCLVGMNTLVYCADNWQNSDFWNRAKTTSDLSTLRQTEVPPVFKRTVPFVAADPAFFPLCGNGVLNTKEDYLRLYGPDLESIPMMRYSKEFLSKTFPSIGQGNLNQMYAFTMITDEVCDDGNRRDLDGCSADCMVYDMLTSSCEIAMERQIKIEDVLPVPDSGDMVVSALDGIYLIKEGDFISNSIQKLTLLRAKSFPIKSMYSYAGDLFFYSSIQQKVYLLVQLQKYKELVVRQDLSLDLKPSDSRVEVGVLGDILIFRDSQTILVEDITNGKTIIKCTFPVVMDNTCNYVSLLKGNVRLECFSSWDAFNLKSTELKQEDKCKWEKICYFCDSYYGSNIWQDIINSFTSLIKYDAYPNTKFYSKFSPELKSEYGIGIDMTPMFLRGQFLDALVFESMLNSPKRIFEQHFGSFLKYVGDELVTLILTAGGGEDRRTCGPEMCFFDRPVGYDALGTSPYLNTSPDIKWNDFLQQLIDNELKRLASYTSAVKTLGDLRFFNGSANYGKIIKDYLIMYRSSILSKISKRLFVHPKSNNMWMVRENSLYEISRSGVQVHVENGLCLPNFMAICPVCFWAESGTACRPCSAGVATSAAWKISCDVMCPSGPKSSSRRLLLSTGSTEGSVVFVVSGNVTMLRTLWPNASLTFWNGTDVSVILKTTDMQATVASTLVKLNGLNKQLTLLVSPYGIEKGSGVGNIVFVIDGTNQTKLKTLWPTGSIVLGYRNITVTIHASIDPGDDILSVNQVLAENPDIRLLVNPYYRVNSIKNRRSDVPEGDSSPEGGGSGEQKVNNDYGMYIGIVVIGFFVVVGLILLCKCSGNNTVPRLPPQPIAGGVTTSARSQYSAMENSFLDIKITEIPLSHP